MRKFLLAIFLLAQWADLLFAQCGTDPVSGLVTISGANQITNSYYPGTANPVAGSTSLIVGAIDSRGSATPIASGDLILIIQIQGADLNTTNTDAYGNGIAGGIASGALSTNLYAGYYEYNTVAGVAGSTINFTYSLANNYYTQAFTTSTPTRKYQVIRVPRYYDLTINAGASVVSPSWNGNTGGAVVLDAVNVITLNGAVNVTGLGFRGGGGKNFTGAGPTNTNGATTLSNTDYRWNSSVTVADNTTGGAKGEGIAGTPIFTFTSGATTTVTEAVEGYINGASGRGAPGNAGGGSTDGIPAGANNNQYNTGGGGGANAGNGGNGGSGWHGSTGNVTTYPYGGVGGTAYTQHTITRFIMGGGGGAGSANNSTAVNEYQSSGGGGGGIILSRARSYAGNGSLLADGADAPGVVGVGGTSNTDAAGGGGGGGTIVAVTRAAGAPGLGSVTASAKGGKGGDMTNYFDHGPGGGGGGGIIYTNGTLASTNITGGINGQTRTGATNGPVDNNFGAAPGTSGQLLTLGYVPTLINNNNIASPCGVLPVTLLNFTGVVKNNSVAVQWTIVNAVNLHHFEVEYSTDGTTFSYAGRKEYRSGDNNYEFLHNYNNGSVIYYRLKLVDGNGSYSYSKTIVLKLNRAGATILLFPNPATTTITLQFRWHRTASSIVHIADATGKVVKQKVMLLQQGDNSIRLTTDDLPAGIYVVQMKVENEIVANERLQVMRK